MSNLQNNHNVYVLGAGFSAERGLPLMADFLNRMRDARDQLDDNEIARAIDTVLEFRGSGSSASDRLNFDLDSIEELFSLADMIDDADLLRAVPLAIAGTLQAAQLHGARPSLKIERPPSLDHFPQAWTKDTRSSDHESARRQECHPSVYDVYLATMWSLLHRPAVDARDTVITFNYDLVLEEAARNLSLEIDYGLEADSASSARTSLTVLKLHGSINWALADDGDAVRTYPDLGELRDEGNVPLLVAPTCAKDIVRPLRNVWSKAIHALSRATRIAIVGYSLPPADTYFRYLLGAGLRNSTSFRQIHFVGYANDSFSEPVGDFTLEQRAKELVRDRLWEDGRATVSSRGARDFFLRTLRVHWDRPWQDAISFTDY